MGMPTVLWGSAYPGINLPYVDLDQAQIGRLLTKQAVEAEYRRDGTGVGRGRNVTD